MTVPTVNVTLTVCDQTGAAVPNAVVKAQLTALDLYNAQYVFPNVQTFTTDVNGLVTMPLFPNQLGQKNTYYNIKATHPTTGKSLVNVTVIVPNFNCDVSALVGNNPSSQPYPLPSVQPYSSILTQISSGSSGVINDLCLNVKNAPFNAQGDGSTDDSAAIQSAATALSATGGGALYFPDGTFIAANISIPGNVRVFGHGATLKLKAAASLNFSPYFKLTAPDVVFEGLTFDGNKANQPADGFSDSWNTGANNTGKSNRAAIYGDNSGTGYAIANVTVRGCHFKNQWTGSVALRNVSTVNVDGNTFENCNLECVFLYVSGAGRNTGARIVNNVCTNIGSGDANVNANAFVTSNYDGVVCANNEVYTCERNLLKMENCTRCSVTGNMLDTNTKTGFNCLQVQAGGSEISVVGNVFRNVQRGIYFETGAITDITIVGNTIDGGNDSTLTPDGIAVISASRVVIANNTIKNCQRHGITFANTSQIVISGNRITPHAAQASLAGQGIFAGHTADASDIVIIGNQIDSGFDQGTAGGNGVLTVSCIGFTVTRCIISDNIIGTKTNAATEKALRVVNGTFVDTVVRGNTTPGLIELAATGVVSFANKAGRIIPTSSFGQIIGSGSVAPAAGTHFVGEVQLHSAPNSGGFIGWVCTTGGTPGTWLPFGILWSNAADVGDAIKTLTAGTDATTQRWNTPLTANRAVTLSTTNVWTGAKFRVVRQSGATGAFTLDVGPGPLKSLAVGQWCDVEFIGSLGAWGLVGFGAL